jgi:hypothetical protein
MPKMCEQRTNNLLLGNSEDRIAALPAQHQAYSIALHGAKQLPLGKNNGARKGLFLQANDGFEARRQFFRGNANLVEGDFRPSAARTAQRSSLRENGPLFVVGTHV